MPLIMNASVVNLPRGEFKKEKVIIDDPIRNEVLIRVAYSGLCHSDLNTVNDPVIFAETIEDNYGVVLGHEISGVVEKIGPDVTEFNIGDHVVCCWCMHCGTCVYCQSDKKFLCLNKATFGRKNDERPRIMRINKQPLAQGYGIGGFAEYALVPTNGIVKIHPTISLKIASIVGCGVLTGYGAVTSAAKVTKTDSVAIIGAGGLGLAALVTLVMIGNKNVHIVDQVKSKLDIAESIGAMATTLDPTIKKLRKKMPDGFDHVFEFVGGDAFNKTTTLAAGIVKSGGCIILTGLPRYNATLSAFSPIEILRKALKIQTCYMGNVDFKQAIPEILRLDVEGELQLEKLITKFISLDDINDAYGNNNEIRQVIHFD